MGNLAGDGNELDTPHDVEVTKTFYMSAVEIPVEVFLESCDDIDYWRTLNDTVQPPAMSLDVEVSPTSDCPVQSVSWNDAVKFCNWLSQRSGRALCYQLDEEDGRACDFSSNGYRLPTEAEWEYACRAGSRTRFFYGDGDALRPDYGHSSNNREIATLPVGSLMPNPWGLFDVHGNVFEWCWDRYGSLTAESAVDPTGPLSAPNDSPARVFRGGGVGIFSGDPDSDARGYTPAETRFWNVGFRIVCGPK